MKQRDPELLDVLEFSLKFGLLPPGSLKGPGLLSDRLMQKRLEFLREELDELASAAADGNLADIADALVDLVVVAKGTALMLGLNWEAHWDEVQRANLSKTLGYVEKRGNKRDLVKPPGWTPPDHEKIIADGPVVDMTSGRDYPEGER